MAKRVSKAERLEAIKTLHEVLWDSQGRPRQVLATVQRVSRSGMSRVIAFRVAMVSPDPRAAEGMQVWLRHISSCIADALGWTFVSKPGEEGVRVSGCGMDMIFHTLDSVTHTIGAELCPDLDYAARRKAFPMPDYRSL